MKIYTRILNNGKREIIWVDDSGQPRKVWLELTDQITEYHERNDGAISMFQNIVSSYEEITEEFCSILMGQTPISLTIKELRDLMFAAAQTHNMNGEETKGCSSHEGKHKFVKRIMNEQLFNK